MKHRPFSELKKHWSAERLARIETRVGRALAELDQKEFEQTTEEKPFQAVTRKSPAARNRAAPTRSL